jgi:hypothetical protein
MTTVQQDYPQTLILEPGTAVEARFIRLERGHTRDGEARAIAVLALDGAERSLWLHERALRDKVRELKPETGELLRIEKGAEKRLSESSGYRYWPFKVEAPDRPAETIGWDDACFADDVPESSTDRPASDVPADTADLDTTPAHADDIPF